MSIHISAEATCDNCGKTAPCKLNASLMGAVGSQRFEKLAVATHDLPGWFWWEHLMACSVGCQEVLSQRPPFSSYSRETWTPFGGRPGW
jgi:hypothetical protein